MRVFYHLVQGEPGAHFLSGRPTLPLFLSVLLLPLSSADYCPSDVNSQIQECVQPVGDYAKLLNNNQTPNRPSGEFSFALPNMGKKVFSDLCRLVAKFNVCVKERRVQCQKHVTIGLVDSSYGYLCNEGYNTFMESAECLVELDRKPQVKRCHDETLKEIEKANGDSALGLAPKVERMCGALNFFSGCVKAPIKEECGAPAWRVIYRVLRDTTRTLMPGCRFTGHSHPRTTPAYVDTIEADAEIPPYEESPLSLHSLPESAAETRAVGLTAAVGPPQEETLTTLRTKSSIDYLTEEIAPAVQGGRPEKNAEMMVGVDEGAANSAAGRASLSLLLPLSILFYHS